MTYFLYSDVLVWHREVPARTYISAVRKAMAEHRLAGRPRCIAHSGNSREYRIDGTGYRFTLEEIRA